MNLDATYLEFHLDALDLTCCRSRANIGIIKTGVVMDAFHLKRKELLAEIGTAWDFQTKDRCDV